MSKHTPGPWNVEDDRSPVFDLMGFNIVAGKIRVVDENGIEPSRQGRANAHLIAAAPELYEALDAIQTAFMSHTNWNGDPPAEIVAARAALAKARGE